MNKNQYRVIFNKTRGLMVVVAENIASNPHSATGKSGGSIQHNPGAFTLNPLKLAVWLMTGSAAVFMPLPATAAGIVADQAAPANQRPDVINAANGVPLVNIQAPSAAGVSRNTYSQFDVSRQGAILNNSKINTQTQLGGWVQGNPNLASGTARVILNEVNSSNPSLLNGYVEIAGSRAQLVVANPAGISCDGCGFINANRATLTTGTPIMNSGNLMGYRVGGGSISFLDSGLDASQANYTDVISRAVQVNAGMWASQLNVIAGTNQITIDNSGNPISVIPIAPDVGSTAPSYAIDVAELGGMYAGKIRLIGTEAGLGVRNAGDVGVNAGEVVLTLDGQLVNKGNIITGDISMDIGDLDNSNGKIVASRSLNAVTSDIDNTSGYVGGNEIIVDSNAITNTDGTWLAEQSLTINATSLSGDGQLLSQGDMSLSLDSDFTNSSDILANEDLTFNVDGKLTNYRKLSAGNTLQIAVDDLDNASGAELSGSNTFISVGNSLVNRGLIDSAGSTFIDAVDADNIGTGRIYGNHIAIQSTSLHNTDETAGGITSAASIAARDRLDIGSTSITNGTGALIFSSGDMAIGGSLDGFHFAIGAAGNIINTSASIESLGDLDISAYSLINQRKTFSMSRVLLSSTSNYWQVCLDSDCDYVHHITQQTKSYEDRITSTSPESVISAAGKANLSIAQISNKYSAIQAGDNLELSGSALSNQGAELYHVTNTITSKNLIHWGDRDHGTTVSSSTSSYLIDTVPATITAGNTLSGSFTHRIDNVSIREHTTPLAATAGVVPGGLTTTSINLSHSSLFHPAPDSNAGYLIETDPRFADYRAWLSSDYMLSQLSFDSDVTQKRLGDGFYEQRLVREQIAELTGKRFLSGYSNDELQYQALMTNALTQMNALTLIPGVALSPVQIAQLTSDIVWLVEQEVTLSDGTITKALVPHVYVRLQNGDLSTSGALLAGNDVHLEVTGDPANGDGTLTTSGTIAGHNIVTINAANISNVRGLIEGRNVSLSAAQDINIEGGSVVGKNSIVATAGNDINVRSSTTDLHVGMDGTSTYVNSRAIDRVAGLYVSNPDAVLVASAGNDINLIAAAIQNSGANTNNTGGTVIEAGNDIVLGVVAEKNNSYSQGRNSWRREKASTDIGTVIQTSGDIIMTAGDDFKAKAASVSSEEGVLQVRAAKDITITAGTNTFESDAYRKINKSGGFGSSKKEYWDSVDQTTRSGSTFSGDTVTLQAGSLDQQGNIAVEGSNVVSTHGTVLEATGDVALNSVVNTLDETHIFKKKRSGLSTSGASISYGTSKLKTSQTLQAVTQSGSTVGSTDGNVVITAGKTYLQKGSDVLAPRGDIDISAQKVDITAALDSSNQTTETKFKQSGITLSISNPVVSAIQTVDQMRQSASETSDPRMKALAAATSALTIKNAYESVSNGIANPEATIDKKLGGIDVSLSVGSSKSSSMSSQHSVIAVESQLAAGGNITVSATGAANNSDINIVGSRIDAGGDTTMLAEDQINLVAAKNSSTLASSSKNSSASVGVSVGTNGAVITASVSKGNGKSNGSEMSWTEAVVQSGETTNLISGGDTRLIGAQVKGNQVVAEFGTVSGGNLDIQSLQDTSSYDSRSKSGGFSVSVPIGAGNYGALMSSSSSKINSDYASVNEQSGIFTGDKGFQVSVAGNTHLKGAIIASTEQAILERKNSLVTGTLTASNIENHAEYKGESSSFSAGVGRHISADGTTRNAPSASAGYSSQEDKASSVTLSGVSGGAVSINDNTAQIAQTGKDSLTTLALLNRDAHIDEDGNAIDSEGISTAATITPIFDQQKVERELNSAVAITQAFSLVAPKAVGDFATNKVAELEKEAAQAAQAGDTNKANELKAEAAKWDEGGVYRVALHVTIGGLITGDLSGAASAGAIASAAPFLTKLQEAVQETLEESGLDDSAASNISQALAQITSFGIGNAIGGTVGSAVALPVDTNNRQLHPREESWIKENAKRYAKEEGITEDEAIAQLTQQALRNVDLLWRALLSDGDDQRAQDFLSQSQETFINELGETQQLFTSPTQQLLRPEMLATEVSQDFYKAFAQSGISRSLTEGLAKELKDSGLGIIKDVNQLAQALYDHPVEVTHAIVDGIWKGFTQLPDTVVDTVQETATAIGESAAVVFNEDITSKLNAIYGTNVADIQKAISAIRVIGAVTGSAAGAKGITNVSEITAKAVTEKLDTVAKEVSRQLDRAAEQTLVKTGGVIDPTTGLPVLDLKSLTNDQKRIMGELFGENTVKQIIPDGSKLARVQGTGTMGIDDLYKVNRSDVDYVVIEYKFNKSVLGDTLDGPQGSINWITGSERLEKAVGREQAPLIRNAILNNRTETWVVRTMPDGSTKIQVLDSSGKVKPVSIDTSTILKRN